MQACQLVKTLTSFFRQSNLDHAFVAAAGAALDQSDCLASRYQRYDAVVLCLQALGEFAYRRPVSSGEAHDLEQEQILQGSDSVLTRNFFTEAQVPADLIPKMRQLLKIGF